MALVEDLEENLLMLLIVGLALYLAYQWAAQKLGLGGPGDTVSSMGLNDVIADGDTHGGAGNLMTLGDGPTAGSTFDPSTAQ